MCLASPCVCVCVLKAALMNAQCNLIGKPMLYEFKLGHNAVEAAKNISYIKSKGSVDHSTVTRWFKKIAWVARTLTIGQSWVGLKA